MGITFVSSPFFSLLWYLTLDFYCDNFWAQYIQGPEYNWLILMFYCDNWCLFSDMLALPRLRILTLAPWCTLLTPAAVFDAQDSPTIFHVSERCMKLWIVEHFHTWDMPACPQNNPCVCALVNIWGNHWTLSCLMKSMAPKHQSIKLGCIPNIIGLHSYNWVAFSI